MEGIIFVDTLYLFVRYPYSDVFERWNRLAKEADYRILKQGIVVGDFVVRPGASGYKVSVWQNDARVFLTPEVDQLRGEGKGMGIWVQLGSKFLNHYGSNLKDGVKKLFNDVGIIGEYETRITRIDLAIDMFDISMQDFDLTYWRDAWVGRSKISSHHFNSRTGDLETFYIGSRKSPIMLRVYDKIAEAIKKGDINYWIDFWGGSKKAVTRFEWEVKTKKGNFQNDLIDFDLFNGYSVRELLAYLLDWGRLCVPDPEDMNRSRWKESKLWKDIRELSETWSDGANWKTLRYGKQYKPNSVGYAKFLGGAISGGIARFGNDGPSYSDMYEGLAEFGVDHKTIVEQAQIKHKRYKNLYGGIG